MSNRRKAGRYGGCEPGAMGFTIIELLVALALMALLLTFISQSMSQIILGQAALKGNVEAHQSTVMLRRLLHRDIQGLWNLETVVLDAEKLEFTTSHCLATPFPLNVRVEWTFGETISRKEEISDVGYSRELVLLEDVKEETLEFYIAEEERWVDVDTFLLDPMSRNKFMRSLRAIRLVLGFEEASVTFVERLPHDELLQLQ